MRFTTLTITIQACEVLDLNLSNPSQERSRRASGVAWPPFLAREPGMLMEKVSRGTPSEATSRAAIRQINMSASDRHLLRRQSANQSHLDCRQISLGAPLPLADSKIFRTNVRFTLCQVRRRTIRRVSLRRAKARKGRRRRTIPVQAGSSGDSSNVSAQVACASASKRSTRPCHQCLRYRKTCCCPRLRCSRGRFLLKATLWIQTRR
jgi:hypothetical protein